MEFFFSQSERAQLIEMLQAKADLYGLDERHIESDHHLAFEGLHVLANGIPERLYAMLHAKGSQSHPGANAGRTMLMLQRIAEHGAGWR